MKKFLYGTVIVLFIFFLYRYPAEGFQASLSGLMLWFQTLLPTLFPLMILSNLIIRLGLVEQLMFFFAPIMKKLYGISGYGSYAMVVGFFCGYPMGAKVIADMTAEQKLSLQEAQFLIGFCNNVSPMFIINFLVLEHLKAPGLILPTLLIIYGAPLLYGLITSIPYRIHNPEKSLADTKKQTPPLSISFEVVDVCIMNGITNIAKLGGYVILFALLTKMILMIPLEHLLLKSCLAGLMEVTNGIHLIAEQGNAFPLTYILLMGIATFGGFSSVAQTESMMHHTGLHLSGYLRDKLCITGIALLLAFLYLSLF